MNYSTSEENYLKTIFHLQEQAGTVSTSLVAEKLHTKPSSVTDMMKKLAAKKLLNYKPYYGFTLSAEGKRIALSVVRRHRLWEYFLAEKLDFGWDEVHMIAEDLEHVSNRSLIEKLDRYLGYPQFDPHGDPIPDNKGRINTTSQISLIDLSLHQRAVLTHVTGQSKLLLDELADKNITIGTAIEIRKKSRFDGSLTVKCKNKILTITETVARHLFVKKI